MASTSIQNDPRAHALLKSAHDRAWRFPESFNGFTADIEVTASGSAPIHGHIDISGPREMDLTLDASTEITDWVKQQIASMVGHRWVRAYENGDGKYDMVLEDDGDPRGALVRQLNDPFTSSYRVLNDAITVVNRQMGTTSFTISMQTHGTATDGRTLPESFTVSYRNTESGALERAEIFQDAYTVVDGMDVPLERRVSLSDGTGVTARQFRFSNVRLHG